MSIKENYSLFKFVNTNLKTKEFMEKCKPMQYYTVIYWLIQVFSFVVSNYFFFM